MDYSNVEEYIDKYLKNFAPFRDKKTYQAYISLLKNNFFKALYEEIPKDIKEYVEKQKISTGLYDRLLIGVGYSQTLLNNLRFSQKQIIIRNLMDYSKYSGSIYYVQKVCEAFKENFNVYELYIDRRTYLNEDEAVVRDWVIAGNPLFASDPNVSFEVLSYDRVYNDTPTLFLSKTALEILRASKSITLPVKTNLISLDLNSVRVVHELDNLIESATFSYFKDLPVDIYVQDQTFTVTMGGLYQIWYYILFKYMGKVDTANLPSAISLFYFSLGMNIFPYTIEPGNANSIDNVIEEYNNLPFDQDKIAEFYKNHLQDNFTFLGQTSNYSIEDFRKRIIIVLGNDIIDYVDSIMEGTENKLFAAIEILGNLDDSLKTLVYNSTNVLLQKYGKYLFNMFPPLMLDPKMSATYQLLTYFKPQHTQLITSAKYTTKFEMNKLNCLPIKTTSRHVVHDYIGSGLVLSDEAKLSRSFETGYYEFTNTNIIKTDDLGAMSFAIGDYVYSREIRTNVFPTDRALMIDNIIKKDTHYELILTFPYTGPIGVFPRAYKLYPPTIDELIDITGKGFFTFTNIGYANIVHTNEAGFLRFNVGDFIYTPDDYKEYGVEIISKDYNTFTFILKTDYKGNPGSWTQAYRWRPA